MVFFRTQIFFHCVLHFSCKCKFPACSMTSRLLALIGYSISTHAFIPALLSGKMYMPPSFLLWSIAGTIHLYIRISRLSTSYAIFLFHKLKCNVIVGGGKNFKLLNSFKIFFFRVTPSRKFSTSKMQSTTTMNLIMELKVGEYKRLALILICLHFYNSIVFGFKFLNIAIYLKECVHPAMVSYHR